MKAHSRSKGRSAAPRRPQDASKADQILNRIKAVTGELEALQSDILHQINQGTGRNAPDKDDDSRPRLLGEFKITLDRLRKVLWSYLEQAQPAGDTKQQAPAPLRQEIYPQSTLADTPSVPPGSFFDRLDVVIDAYMKNTV